MRKKVPYLVVALVVGFAQANAESLTIAAFDSPETRALEALSVEWEESSGHALDWQFMGRQILTERVAADLLAGLDTFDIVTLDAATIRGWGYSGRLLPLTLLDDAGLDDSIWNSQSVWGELYGVPFSAETALTFYDVDLFEALGIAMPVAPTVREIVEVVAAVEKSDTEMASLCLAGGNGHDSLAVLGLLAHALGDAQLDHPGRLVEPEGTWEQGLELYVELVGTHGPPGATALNEAEILGLFAAGRCAVWVGGRRWLGPLVDLLGPDRSGVLGVALAPGRPGDGSVGWLRSQGFAALPGSAEEEAIMGFLEWAGSGAVAQRAVEMDPRAYGILGRHAGDERVLADVPLSAEVGRLLEAMRQAVPTGLDAVQAPLGDDRAAAVGELGESIQRALSGADDVPTALDRMANIVAHAGELPNSYSANAGGLIGDLIEGICGNCGVGRALDAIHEAIADPIVASRLFAGPGQFPPQNFAAYGIVAFPEQATSADRARHEMLCEAYMAAFLSSADLRDRLNVPLDRQMVTVWPLDDETTADRLNGRESDGSCAAAVERYDLAMGQLAIAEAGEARIGRLRRGPYLFAWSPATAKGEPGVVVLMADLSNVTTPDHASDLFRIWRRDIESNPELWDRRWDIERLRIEIRLWADRLGEPLVSLLGL